MIGRTLKYISILMWYLLIANTTFAYTRQDTLRGSNGSGRNWWDVQHYDLSIKIDTATKQITGVNYITLKVISEPVSDSLQLDLQEPMVLDEVVYNDLLVNFIHEGNVYWVRGAFHDWKVDSTYTLYVEFHGKPRQAKNPPWDGGFIWTHDSTGNPWIAVACQGLGASAWWPCKDAQWDEPDKGAMLTLEVNKGLEVVGNGREVHINDTAEAGYEYKAWEVKNPINTYDLTFYIGDYVHWHDTLMGEQGKLDLSYYVLRENLSKARKQFEIVKPMLHCFESWMGPYPFYEDGYKLVEAPYLGMEHQSAVAYGNKYMQGYLGRDRSNTGVGMLFDFIIVHESGHEWFGNSVTAKDIADNWIHEGITTYAEALFVECLAGKEKAFDYTRGEWKNIKNDRAVIGDYGVNDDGSDDKYDKGSAVMHMIRTMMHDDDKFKAMMRSISDKYYHKTVTSAKLEKYIIDYTGLDLKIFFDQYLRSDDIPELEWYIKDNELFYRFNNVLTGFTLPIEVTGGRRKEKIYPKADWQSISWKRGGYNVSFSNDFLIRPKP